MGILNRNIEKIEEKNRKKHELQEGLKRLKAEKLSNKDALALIMAMFQLVLPIALGILSIYFLLLLFITKVWMA